MNTAITEETRKVYKEVNDVLNIMGSAYKGKIPPKILMALNENEAKDYVSSINPELSFTEQKISSKALAILTIFNLMYWIEDKEEKARLTRIYKKNDAIYDKKIAEKYDSNKIFERQDISKDIKNKLNSISDKGYENVSKKEINKKMLPVKNNIFTKIRRFFSGLLK